MMLIITRVYSTVYGPVERHPAELSLNTVQESQRQELLTQAIRTPFAGTRAAETGVAVERYTTVWMEIQMENVAYNTPSHHQHS